MRQPGRAVRPRHDKLRAQSRRPERLWAGEGPGEMGEKAARVGVACHQPQRRPELFPNKRPRYAHQATAYSRKVHAQPLPKTILDEVHLKAPRFE